MSTIAADAVLPTFLLFCRIGGCLMLMPGFSSTRIPMQVRLFLAVAVTLALAPLLLPTVSQAAADPALDKRLGLVVAEVGTGALIGLLGRLFFLALQFMATAAAAYVGFTTGPAPGIEDAEPAPTFATLLTLTATVLFFLTDQHVEVLRALVGSYAALPVSETMAVEFSLHKVLESLGLAFVLALQISAPFIVLSLTINFGAGIANKLIPQIPVYFIATPFILAGGLVLLYFTVAEFLTAFTAGFARWLAAG